MVFQILLSNDLLEVLGLQSIECRKTSQPLETFETARFHPSLYHQFGMDWAWLVSKLDDKGERYPHLGSYPYYHLSEKKDTIRSIAVDKNTTNSDP